jgi:hypothetical protein
MPIENARDPRVHLVRAKYFSLRPRPLEQWLWSQGIPASAERVFWLHWQEGLQRGDWCSEIPLSEVARHCRLDVSTVTRAYQLLARLGCVRRTDPGRDPTNPFQQATAVTEVRVPRELVTQLDQFPNRQSRRAGPGAQAGEASARSAGSDERVCSDLPIKAAEVQPVEARPADPFDGLAGRDRVRAISQLTERMSAGELFAYREAMRMHRAHMSFDADTKLTANERATVLQLLSRLAVAPVARPAVSSALGASRSPAANGESSSRLSRFELARIRHQIHLTRSEAEPTELFREVVWSIEEGALRRFEPTHAIHIALKKIREGAWTRPHRMPPNWMRRWSVSSGHETCRRA